MTEPINGWEEMDNGIQHVAALNGWVAQIWDYGADPDVTHPDGLPFNWSIAPGMMLVEGPDREGFAATLDAAKAAAETGLRDLAVNPAPEDEGLADVANIVASHALVGGVNGSGKSDFDDFDRLIETTKASVIAKLDAATDFDAVLTNIATNAAEDPTALGSGKSTRALGGDIGG